MLMQCCGTQRKYHEYIQALSMAHYCALYKHNAKLLKIIFCENNINIVTYLRHLKTRDQ